MKLILSSRDFLNDKSKKVIINNISKKLEDCRVLFIPNEKATTEDVYSDKYYNRLYKDGFINRNNIYIYDESDSDRFKNLNLDIIYVGGGNTFATLDKIRKNSFDKVLYNYVRNGVTYIGGSCGAHIVSKNIKHVLNFEDNITGIIDYNGLGLFDGIIIPHYDESRKKIYIELLSENKYNIYTLTNDESLVIIDDSIEHIT